LLSPTTVHLTQDFSQAAMAISATHMHMNANCTSARSGRSNPALSFSSYVCGNKSAFSIRDRSARGETRGSLVVQMAASREKKHRDVNMLKGMLSNDDTLLVAGFRFQGLSVRKFIESPTPERASLFRYRPAAPGTTMHVSNSCVSPPKFSFCPETTHA
tara:strand:- start:754 stop:1230 length:477 start_codon:yes stop_codon:yes gene_type:complete